MHPLGARAHIHIGIVHAHTAPLLQRLPRRSEALVDTAQRVLVDTHIARALKAAGQRALPTGGRGRQEQQLGLAIADRQRRNGLRRADVRPAVVASVVLFDSICSGTGSPAACSGTCGCGCGCGCGCAELWRGEEVRW